MTFTWVLVTLLWSSFLAVTDIGGLVMPDIALVLAVWAGLRSWHRNEDIRLALLLGLIAGLFTVDPWFFPALLALVAVIMTSTLRERLAARSLVGRSILVVSVLLLVAAFESMLRMSVPSLILDPNTLFGMASKTLISIPLAIVLDQVTPQRI